MLGGPRTATHWYHFTSNVETQYVPPARLFFLFFVVTGGATLFVGIGRSLSSPGLPPLIRVRPSLSFSRTTGEAAGLYLNSGEYLN